MELMSRSRGVRSKLFHPIPEGQLVPVQRFNAGDREGTAIAGCRRAHFGNAGHAGRLFLVGLSEGRAGKTSQDDDEEKLFHNNLRLLQVFRCCGS